MLSFGSKFFDLPGWISPIVAAARMLFQKLCKKKYGWNDDGDEADPLALRMLMPIKIVGNDEDESCQIYTYYIPLESKFHAL